MIRIFRVVVLAGSFSASGLLVAQSEPTQVLESALATYKADGPEAFVEKLLEGGPMEGNKDAVAQASMLRAIQTYYGPYGSFEVVDSVELTSTTRFVYVVFNYAGGPMFGAFTFYRNAKGWIVVNFNFHTEASQVWPGRLLAGN